MVSGHCRNGDVPAVNARLGPAELRAPAGKACAPAVPRQMLRGTVIMFANRCENVTMLQSASTVLRESHNTSTRKLCRKETARCRSCSIRFKVRRQRSLQL